MNMEKRTVPAELKIDSKTVKDLLVRFIKDQMGSAGFSKCVIGISGGVDSATAAALTAEAVRKENVLGVILPYRTGNPKSIEDAKLVIQKTGIRSEIIDISNMVDAYCNENNVTDPLRRGNVMARIRMIVLYDISAREKALVVGTSNKTELLIGYGTQYGDSAYAFNPLGDLYKSQIWQLAEELKIPRPVIDKAPSADLWEGQTDEGEIGISYNELDSLLLKMIDEGLPDDELFRIGYTDSLIKKVRGMIIRNGFKRRMPAIAKASYNRLDK